MTDFPIYVFAWYCSFGFFLFYQQKHLMDFRGSSAVFQSFLSISVMLGMLTGIVFLGYYAWNYSALTSVAMFVLSIPIAVFYNLIEKFIPPFFISLIGFIGWPLSSYMMFTQI